MRALVTGAAGFIGSHLAERLVADGHDVVGVDCFTDYYARSAKEANVAGLRSSDRFELIEAEIGDLDLPALLEDVELIFHQAAQAGVRASWGESFRVYTRLNVDATQQLLEAAKDAPRLRKLVYASSSSVYGATRVLPMKEDHPTQPVSPYGVTKLAAEHLASLYHLSFGLPTVSLRYFTVYGPRQRPDMAFHRFLRAALTGEPLTLFGDGTQTRDFTFVADAVEANVRAALEGPPGTVANIGGGSRVSILEIFDMIRELVGRDIEIESAGTPRGEMKDTVADTTVARSAFGYQPSVSIREGLERERDWVASFHGL